MTEYQSTTTLNRIRDAGPCREGWEKLLAHLGKTKADDEPLQLMTVLDSNGLDDALWVLSYAMPDDRLARHFQAWCAEQVLHIFEAERPTDTRVRDQIAMLRNDEATAAALAAARDAALAAARVGRRTGRRIVRRTRRMGRRRRRIVRRMGRHDAALSAARAAWDAQEKQFRKMLSA
jgi:hypothetical protein